MGLCLDNNHQQMGFRQQIPIAGLVIKHKKKFS
jgi:hypothetical protein